MFVTPGQRNYQTRNKPSVVNENMLNISRCRPPPSKQLRSSRTAHQQRTPSQTRPQSIRQVVSTPALRPPSSRHRLKPRGSRLDLLDNQNLTSFPSFSFEEESSLHIIENYFPAKPVSLNEPLDPSSNSWSILLHKKLRWRWRLTGLLP